MGLSETQLFALRRKLDALGYTDPVEPTSGITPLSPARKPTGAAVDILQAANARIASLQRQLMERDAQLAALRQQSEALRQDVARLQSNNSSLLVQLKQAKEQNEHSDKGNYQTVKSLEDRIAELTFWQQSALSRLESSEKDNDALKAKVVELVKLTDQLTAGITPLSPARKPTGAAVDILQAANARIASLQRQLMERDAQLAALRQQVTSSIDGSQREVAGQRLRAGSGADSDVAALTARNEANESMILQLNSTRHPAEQVESLGQQLRSLEATAKDKARLEGQLASEQRLRAEADDKLRRAVKDNEGIMHEVTSRVQVTGLRARLADSRSETQRLASQLDALSSERTAAMSQVSSLQRELDGLRGLLADTTARADDLRSQAYTANEELQAALDNLASKDSQLGEVERRMAALAAELDARKRAGDKAELEREAAAT
ncbi:BLD10 protein, partial [Haematococcus lacustris]